MALIRNFERADFDCVMEIYQAGIDTGFATFEAKTKDWETWDSGAMPAPRLVAIDDTEKVVGWACLAAVTHRCVYAGVAEISVYVDPKAQGQGIGGQLLGDLILGSEEVGIWTLQARIFPENGASIALHHKLGFRQVGKQERLAQLHGVWRDIVLMERRSTVVGVD